MLMFHNLMLRFLLQHYFDITLLDVAVFIGALFNAPLFNVFNFALFTTALSLYSVPLFYYSTTIGCYTLFKLYYLMLQYFNIALCDFVLFGY